MRITLKQFVSYFMAVLEKIGATAYILLKSQNTKLCFLDSQT
ncbi:hypothetical protein IFVP177_C160007 [Vibrio parahaemolyticus]